MRILAHTPDVAYARFKRTLMGEARPAISIVPLNQVIETGSVFRFLLPSEIAQKGIDAVVGRNSPHLFIPGNRYGGLPLLVLKIDISTCDH